MKKRKIEKKINFKTFFNQCRRQKYDREKWENEQIRKNNPPSTSSAPTTPAKVKFNIYNCLFCNCKNKNFLLFFFIIANNENSKTIDTTSKSDTNAAQRQSAQVTRLGIRP